MKTHKIVKNEGINNGMNYIAKITNKIIKTGNEKSIRKYFEELYLRAHKYAAEDTIKDCKSIIKSKNQIYINTIKDTVLIFEVKKLTPKELREYNN